MIELGSPLEVCTKDISNFRRMPYKQKCPGASVETHLCQAPTILFLVAVQFCKVRCHSSPFYGGGE